MQAAINALKTELRTQEQDVERWEQKMRESMTRVDVLRQAIAVMQGIAPTASKSQPRSTVFGQLKGKQAQAKPTRERNEGKKLSGDLRYYTDRKGVDMVETDGMESRRVRRETVERVEKVLRDRRYITQKELTAIVGDNSGDTSVAVRAGILRGNLAEVGWMATQGRSTRVIRHKNAPDPVVGHQQALLPDGITIGRWADETIDSARRGRRKPTDVPSKPRPDSMTTAAPDKGTDTDTPKRETVIQPGVGIRSGRIAIGV